MAARCGPVALALAALVLRVAGDTAAGAGGCQAEDCAVEGGLEAEEGGREAALHLLQRRGARVQEQPQAVHPPNNKFSIDWDSSKHGNGPIWHHWQKLLQACNSTVITRSCRRKMAGMATSVFRLLQFKEGHNYTKTEIKQFKSRFAMLLKENTTLVMQVKEDMEDYRKWKEAVFHIYELMRPAVTQQFVDEVNREHLGWRAVYREEMADDSVMKVMGMTGLEFSDAEAATLLEETRRAEAEDLMQLSQAREAMPHSFDARHHWPQCGTVLRHVRYQDCNNCWSHASALVTESRVCIASGGRFNGADAWLSQSFIALCRTDRKPYCSGGSGALGFSTVNGIGVPTGAPNKLGNAQPGTRTCVPQVKADMNGVRCPATCTEQDYPRSLESDLFYPRFAPRSLSPRGSAVLDMAKQSILQEGPMLFGLKVYTDFWSYSSGIYKPANIPSNRNMGGHAVTGMGFGPRYFLCINSWGPNWGENGAFKVADAALDLVVVLPGYVHDSSAFPTPVP
mmetsp:Transcript_29164/g.69056  ORF Transcript_29164/g.69056 Transcript_29164/m.69056 type:complete len:510 (-) Transcript_29164:67-1596(-)